MDAKIADDTTAQAPARGLRLVVLAGFVGFTLTFAVFHFILPVRLWESSASESSVSLFLCAVVAVLTAAVVAFLLSRNLRLENQRMRSAINNMSQGLCMFDGNVAVQTAKATEDISRLITAVQQATTSAVSAIERISGRMQEIDSCATAVSVAVEEQNAATGEFSQNVTSASDGARIVVSVLGEVSGAAAATRHSAESVLTASQAVEVAAGALRKEVEGFLSRVAA